MAGLVLDRVASVWRTTLDTNADGGYGATQVYSAVRCAIVPVSQDDAPIAYALQSTHIVWVESWIVLLKEDEVRWGRRTDAAGDIQQEAFVVNGRRRFTQAPPQIAFYVREQD